MENKIRRGKLRLMAQRREIMEEKGRYKMVKEKRLEDRKEERRKMAHDILHTSSYTTELDFFTSVKKSALDRRTIISSSITNNNEILPTSKVASNKVDIFCLRGYNLHMFI
jgi:hypothetical protein